MKHLLFLLLLSPFFASAQREIANDTTYQTKVGNLYYHVNLTSYTDGGPADQRVELLGDSAALISYYANKAVGAAGQISAAALIVMRRGQAIQSLRQWDASVLALTGSSPLRSIQNSIEGAFLSGSWSIQDAGVVKAVTLSKNPTTGALRYLVTGSTQKAVETFGPGWIMLKNYPTAGQEVSLYQITPKLWSNIERTILLKK